MSDSDATFVAWCAGFFDGEGSISIIRFSKKTNLKLWLTITQADRRPLEEIMRRFGGSIVPVKKSAPHRKQLHRWRTTSAAAARFLHAVRPHLRVKIPHAELAFEFINTIGQRGRSVSDETMAERGSIRARLKALNASASLESL